MLQGIPIGLLHKIAKGYFFIWLSVHRVGKVEKLCNMSLIKVVDFFIIFAKKFV